MFTILKNVLRKLRRSDADTQLPPAALGPALLKVRQLSPRHRQALDLAHRAHVAFDEAANKMGQTVAKPSGIGRIACAGGCSHCCSLYVSATPTELLLIEAFIGGLDDDAASVILGRIRRARHRAIGKNMQQRSVNRLPCPLLSENRTCSVYDARPVSCRAYVSFDRSACVRDEDSPARGLLVPRSQSLEKLGSEVFSRLNHRERQQGYASGSYELVQGLNALIASPAAVENICAGKNPLAIARTR